MICRLLVLAGAADVSDQMPIGHCHRNAIGASLIL